MKIFFGWQICAFLVIFLFEETNGFATKYWFKYVPVIPFGDTKTHDLQTDTVLCFTQYNFLKRNFGLNTPVPQPYNECPTFSEVLDDSAMKDAIDDFVDGSTKPDTDSELKHNPVYHFDGEKLIESNKNILKIKKDMLNTVRNLNERKIFEERKQIRKNLGVAMHILQDFYSHTNWLEMGNGGININLGATKNLNVKLAAPNMTMCRNCEHREMYRNESELLHEIWKKWNDSLLLPDAVIDSKIIDFDRIYVCRNNIKNGDHLTSGYYGGEEVYAEKPDDVNKCSHGGSMDSTVHQNATGGISKDTDSMFFDPHYYLHHGAANLSVQASVSFLENFRVLLKDEHKFGLLIGINLTSLNIVRVNLSENLIVAEEVLKQAAQSHAKFIVYKNVDLYVKSASNSFSYFYPIQLIFFLCMFFMYN